MLPEDRAFGIAISKRLQETEDIPVVDIWDENTQVVGEMLLAKQELAVMVVARLTNGPDGCG